MDGNLTRRPTLVVRVRSVVGRKNRAAPPRVRYRDGKKVNPAVAAAQRVRSFPFLGILTSELMALLGQNRRCLMFRTSLVFVTAYHTIRHRAFFTLARSEIKGPSLAIIVNTGYWITRIQQRMIYSRQSRLRGILNVDPDPSQCFKGRLKTTGSLG